MISSLQRTHDLLISLRYVRERIQKETLFEIKDQRLNFVSDSLFQDFSDKIAQDKRAYTGFLCLHACLQVINAASAVPP